MQTNRVVATLVVLGNLTLIGPAAANIAGGGNTAVDCYAEWGGLDCSGTTVDCVDGDASCDADGVADGVCTVAVSICALQSDSTTCTAAGPLSKLTRTFQARHLAMPDLAAGGCGTPTTFRLKLRGRSRRPSRVAKLRMVAVGPAGKDKNRLRLRCVKAGGSCPQPCPANPEGGPRQITLTSAEVGTDLDNGWTGTSHDFPVVVGSQISMCLSNCNLTADPLCDGEGAVGAGTPNGLTFGAPLPLFAAGTPVCVVNRFADAVRGTADLSTGEVTGTVHLLADVYQAGDTGNVCTRCQSDGGIGSSGTCGGGPDAGRPCTVDGTGFVSDSTGSKSYKLSKSCRPDGALVGTLDIALPLTTGTSSLSGPKPCTARSAEPLGLIVKDDKCQENGGTCTGECLCASHDSLGNCLDAKGGVRQVCCSNDATRSCFPTGPGTAGKIERAGHPGVPLPALPDATFPKAADLTQAAVFCEPATRDSNVINTLTGLPGPGALLLPSHAIWVK
jgi:hypothetical protein